MATADTTPANGSKDKAAPVTRPERPDEEAYKTELGKAEKELRSAEERMVCTFEGGVNRCHTRQPFQARGLCRC